MIVQFRFIFHPSLLVLEFFVQYNKTAQCLDEYTARFYSKIVWSVNISEDRAKFLKGRQTFVFSWPVDCA